MSSSLSSSTAAPLEALIAQARNGSPAALGELWGLCRAQLLAVANREMSDDVRAKAGASDLVQETFLRAQQGLMGFSGTTLDELLAWVRTILRNHLANTRRHYHSLKRRVDRELPLGSALESCEEDVIADVQPSPGSVCVAAEDAASITAALQRIDGDYRRVLELRYWKQQSFVDIGREMNRSAEAARKLWARALLKLQREMDT